VVVDLTSDAGFTAGRVDVLAMDDAVVLLGGAGAVGGGGACIGGGHPCHNIVLLLWYGAGSGAWIIGARFRKSEILFMVGGGSVGGELWYLP